MNFKFALSTLLASLTLSACGQTSTEQSQTKSSGFKEFLIANCPNESLGGHNTLYLTAVVPNRTKKISQLKAPALEFAPELTAEFSKAEQDGGDIVVQVNGGQIQTAHGKQAIEGLRLNKRERTVVVTYYIQGSDDVHVDAMFFENCNVQNTGLLLKGGL